MDCSAAGVTVSELKDETLPTDAVMFAVPTPMPVARPEAFTVATVVAVEVQATEAVRSCVAPFK